jgi:carbon storage regulator CsrA
MLCLTRKKQEAVRIRLPEGEVRIIVLDVSDGKVSLGIDAPKNLRIDRIDQLGKTKAEK